MAFLHGVGGLKYVRMILTVVFGDGLMDQAVAIWFDVTR